MACGDDITQVTNVGMDSVAAYEDLSECTTQKEGVLIYVKDKGNTYLCSDESWHSVKGEDGKNGTNGTNGKSAFDLAKEQDPSLTLANWLASLKGANGSNGTNCSVSKSGSTTTIDCGGGNTATITDGAPGSSGSQGPKGDPGSSGSKGADGVGCSVQSDGNGGAIVICGASSSSVAISKGEPGSSGSKGDTGYGCDIVDDGSGTLSVKCGPDGNPTSTATIYKAVCGTTPYDPAANFCVGVTLYELCGDNKETYDPTGYECVDGVVKEKITAAMCGTDTYDPETQFCAIRNNVVERIYKKVIIVDQTWMAENLNYETAEGSYCYNNDPSNCTTYGRLYTWAAAMAACPDGWHLPTKAEFETLITSAGGSLDAGKALKSKSDWNGSDDFAFSALPAGFREEDGQFLNKGDDASFWSSTEVDDRVYVIGMYDNEDGEYEDDGAYVLKRDKNYGRSVRCIQNDPQ